MSSKGGLDKSRRTSHKLSSSYQASDHRGRRTGADFLSGLFLAAFFTFLAAGALCFSTDFFAFGSEGAGIPTAAAIFPAVVPMVFAVVVRIPLDDSCLACFFAMLWEAYHEV
jgi:hypothetical protein